MARLRSLLFAPGNRSDVLTKLPRSGPDGAVIDLEDAVPADAKPEARAIAREVIAELAPAVSLFVRVNAVPTEWFEPDVAEALAPGLSGVVVPKLESYEQVSVVAEALDRAELDLPVLAGIETAAGVARAEETLAPDRVVGAYFGAEDFVADMGGVRTAGNNEVLYARSRVALAARLTGVAALDQIVTDLRDEEVFEADAEEGRALGYRGKLCIHPAQVPWANRVFSPSHAEVERARRLLAAYDQAVAAGRAAIEFDGQMIDEPLARQARALLESDPPARVNNCRNPTVIYSASCA